MIMKIVFAKRMKHVKVFPKDIHTNMLYLRNSSQTIIEETKGEMLDYAMLQWIDD